MSAERQKMLAGELDDPFDARRVPGDDRQLRCSAGRAGLHAHAPDRAELRRRHHPAWRADRIRRVIGAGSVVTRDVPENVLAAGNPCRVLRDIAE